MSLTWYGPTEKINGNRSDPKCMGAKQLVHPSKSICLHAYCSSNFYHRLNSAEKPGPDEECSPPRRRFSGEIYPMTYKRYQAFPSQFL